MKLRDNLLAALSELPGVREFHLHVLVSAPRKTQELFPYATIRHRIYVQDILVLVSEKALGSGREQAKRVLVTAIEAAVYNVPATSSAIFYVSKVDSTGQGSRPSPTPSLVRALLHYYINPATRPFHINHLWIHVFARAQGQYLFPNSSEHPAKKVLSDRKLCAWWKRVLGDVAREVASGVMPKPETSRLYYILPGYEEMEAKQALGESLTVSVDGAQWIYGHPYSQTDILLPYNALGKDTRHNLGQIIPSFDDDPKSRFIDEIACTTRVDAVVSPKRKRQRTNTGPEDKSKSGGATTTAAEKCKESEKSKGKEKDDKIHGELNVVGQDDFWERMSFRQECVAGAITGFFVMGYSWPSATLPTPSLSPLAPQPGQVSHNMNKRLVASLLTGHEFSTTERSLRATEILEGAIRGLCEGMESIMPSSSSNKPPETSSDRVTGFVPVEQFNDGRKTPEPRQPVSLLAPPRTPPRRPGQLRLEDISPNPFPEPEASLETYTSYIYGSVAVNKPVTSAVLTTEEEIARKRAEVSTPGVTVLTIRRKRKDKR